DRGSPAEPVVHADAEDIVVELDLARREHVYRDETAGERPVAAEVDIEKLALDRPAITDGIFGADADRPAGAPIGLRERCDRRIAVEPRGRIDLGIGAAAGDVPQPLVPDRVAQPQARSSKPPLLRRSGPQVGVQILEPLAFLVGHRPVALDPDDPAANLVIAAALGPAEEPGNIEAIGDAGA